MKPNTKTVNKNNLNATLKARCDTDLRERAERLWTANKQSESEWVRAACFAYLRMRHTFGSLRASAGRSIYKIAVWLGDSVKTTERHYAKLLPIDPEIDV